MSQLPELGELPSASDNNVEETYHKEPQSSSDVLKRKVTLSQVRRFKHRSATIAEDVFKTLKEQQEKCQEC